MENLRWLNYSTLFSNICNICTSNLSPVHQATSPTAKLLSTAGATREAGGLMLCEDQILRAKRPTWKNPLATCLVKAALQKGCNRISAWWMFLVEFCKEKTVVWLKLWEFSQMSVISLFKKKKNTRCKKQNLRNQCNSHFSTFETSINSIRKIWGGVLYTQTHTAKFLTWY